jgi:hypothetical protein
MFGVAQSGRGALAVRRVLPPVSQRHLDRMPPHLREAHGAWLRDGDRQRRQSDSV